MSEPKDVGLQSLICSLRLSVMRTPLYKAWGKRGCSKKRQVIYLSMMAFEIPPQSQPPPLSAPSPPRRWAQGMENEHDKGGMHKVSLFSLLLLTLRGSALPRRFLFCFRIDDVKPLAPQLIGQWGSLALTWGTACSIQAIAFQSLQLFRALMPRVKMVDFALLVGRLSSIIASAYSGFHG